MANPVEKTHPKSPFMPYALAGYGAGARLIANFAYAKILHEGGGHGFKRMFSGTLPTALQILWVTNASSKADSTVTGQLAAGVPPAIYSSLLMQPTYATFVQPSPNIEAASARGAKKHPPIAMLHRLGAHQTATLATTFLETASLNSSVAAFRIFPAFLMGVGMRWLDWSVLFAVQRSTTEKLGFVPATAAGVTLSTALSSMIYVSMFDAIKERQMAIHNAPVGTLQYEFKSDLKYQWRAIRDGLPRYFIQGSGMWPRFLYAALGAVMEKCVVTAGIEALKK